MVGTTTQRYDRDFEEPKVENDELSCIPVEAARVIVFDWDDTLMASSWVSESKMLHIDSFASLPGLIQARFTILEELVGRCLYAAAKLGSVVIITNAEEGWIHYSATRFMPRLLPLLESMRVVSARSTYEKYYPAAPLCWKAAAFAHEANQLFGEDRADGLPREIISFGDSNEERTAVKIASQQLNAVSKSVKFVEMPTPEQLCKQVETITLWLDWVTGHPTELDLMLRATSPGETTTSMPDALCPIDPSAEQPRHPLAGATS